MTLVPYNTWSQNIETYEVDWQGDATGLWNGSDGESGCLISICAHTDNDYFRGIASSDHLTHGDVVQQIFQVSKNDEEDFLDKLAEEWFDVFGSSGDVVFAGSVNEPTQPPNLPVDWGDPTGSYPVRLISRRRKGETLTVEQLARCIDRMYRRVGLPLYRAQ